MVHHAVLSEKYNIIYTSTKFHEHMCSWSLWWHVTVLALTRHESNPTKHAPQSYRLEIGSHSLPTPHYQTEAGWSSNLREGQNTVKGGWGVRTQPVQVAERGKMYLHVPVLSRPNHNPKDRNNHSVYVQTEILRCKEDRLFSWGYKDMSTV